MARVALEAQTADSPAAARRHRSLLVAQIDPVSGWDRLRDGELVPPISLAVVMKTLPGRSGTDRLKPLTPQDLRLHDLGRTRRQPSLALRELLGTLDGERCRFPGCTRHRSSTHITSSTGPTTTSPTWTTWSSARTSPSRAQGAGRAAAPCRRSPARAHLRAYQSVDNTGTLAGMTTQIAVRLEDAEVEALDAEVAQGRASNRSDAVRRSIARLRRDQRYRGEESVLLELARRGGALYPDLDGILDLPHPPLD